MNLLYQKLRRYWRQPVALWRHRGLRPQDVLIASYPRSGNTWLKFLLYETLTGRPTVFETVRRAIPDLGGHAAAADLLPGGGRLIKTHETLLPPGVRAVYLVRDPRDVALSEYAFLARKIKDFRCAWPDFTRAFLDTGLQGYGTWQEHVHFWTEGKAAAEGRVYTLRYETLLEDPLRALEGVLQFLKAGADAQAIEKAVSGNTLKAMKEKEAAAGKEHFGPVARPDLPHVAFGEAGRWREKFTDELIEEFRNFFGATMRKHGYSIVPETAR